LTGCVRQLTLLIAAAFCLETRCDETVHTPVTCLAISGDGQLLVSGSQHGITVRGWQQFDVLRRLPISFQQLHDLCLSPDESMLAIAGGNQAQHATIEVYSWPGLELIWRKEFSEDVAYSVAFDAAGTDLAVAGHDHRVHLMSAATGDVLRVLSGHSKPVTCVEYLPDGKLLLSCSIDQTIRIWNPKDGALVRSLTNHTLAVNQVAAATPSDGRLALAVSAGEDRTIRVWQPTIGRMVRFVRFDTPVSAVAWDVDGDRVFAATKDQRLNSIDTQTLDRKVLNMPRHGWIYCIAVHPSRSELAVGTSNGGVRRVSFSGNP